MIPNYTSTARRRGANLTTDRHAWRDHAACTGHLDTYEAAATELDRKTGPRKGPATDAAIALCHQCPVRQQCLDHALNIETSKAGRWSIQGGLTPGQRQRLATQTNAPETPQRAVCPKCETDKPITQFRDWPKRRACTTCLNAQERQRHDRVLDTEQGRAKNRANTARSRAKAAAA